MNSYYINFVLRLFILSAALPKIKYELSVLTKEKLVNWLFEGWNDKYYSQKKKIRTQQGIDIYFAL